MTINDRELDRRLAALTREADPAPENWISIERRIRARRWPAALAAAVLLGVAALVVMQAGPDLGPSTGADAFVRDQVNEMRAAAPDARAVAMLDPAGSVMDAWRENQAAIGQLEKALQRDPGNRLLLEFLAEARMRQARLMHNAMNANHQPRMEL